VKKLNVSLLAGLVAVAAAASLGAQDIKINLDPDKAPAKPASPAAPAAPAAPAKYTDEQKLEVWGYMLAQQIGLGDLGFSPAEVAAIARGMALNVQGREPSYPLQEIGPQMQALLQSRAEVARARQEKVVAALLEKNKKDSDAFVATLKGKPGIVETASGLRYEIVQPGKGAKPRADQAVSVNYKGSFVNGEVFDSSEARGKPAEFVLSQVIKGWSEGLQLIAPGGKIKLYVPASLGYGDSGMAPVIQPGAFLIFEAELLEVKDAPKEAAAPAAK